MALSAKTPMWQPASECMPREELEQLQLERLEATLSRVYRHVPFYRKRFDAIGFDPDDLRALSDLRRLPHPRLGPVHGATLFSASRSLPRYARCTSRFWSSSSAVPCSTMRPVSRT